jgi:NAD+ kinase
VRLGVCAKADVERRVELADQAVTVWEKLEGRAPELPPPLADVLGREGGTPVADMQADVILVIGGDGSILWTLMQKPEAKVLGINTGELGYLTEAEPEGLSGALERLHEGDYFVERRCKLAVRKDGGHLGSCINEMVIKTPRPSKLLTFRVEADDHVIENVRADGVILSTPTGSTSYAMSAGGPLVHPGLEAMLFVPLAPFRTNLRPIVLPIRTTVQIELEEEDKEGVLALDGQVEHTVRHGDVIELTRADEQARFVRFEPHFYSRMRDLFG